MVRGGLSLPLDNEPGPSSPVLAHCDASNSCLFPACGSLIKVRQISPLATLIAEFGCDVKNISCGMNNKSGSSFFLALMLGEQPRVHHHSVKEVTPAAPTSVCPTHPFSPSLDLHSTLSDALGPPALLRVQLPKGTWKWGAFQKQEKLPGCTPHPQALARLRHLSQSQGGVGRTGRGSELA